MILQTTNHNVSFQVGDPDSALEEEIQAVVVEQINFFMGIKYTASDAYLVLCGERNKDIVNWTRVASKIDQIYRELNIIGSSQIYKDAHTRFK